MLLQNTQFNCAALLFDMDGTLLNSELPTVRAYTAWAGKYGLDAHQVLRTGQGRRAADVITGLAPAGADVQRDIQEVMRHEREDLEGIFAIPGAIALLRSLPVQRWAIVTSADEILARNRLNAAGVPIPEVFITAEAVQRGKPAPDGYLLAASRLGGDPAQCIVFEDAPAGLAAGAAAGARVIAIASELMQGRLDGFDSLDDYCGVQAVEQDGSLVLSVR